MGIEEGGSPSAPLSEIFEKLVAEKSKKISKGAPPKFVKRIEDVPVVALPPEDTIRLALSLAERALIGKFTRLYKYPKTTESWVQRIWRPLFSKNVASYLVGRGYFLFEFEAKEDKELIF